MSIEKAVKTLRKLWGFVDYKDADLDWWRVEKIYSGHVEEWIKRIQKSMEN